MDVPITLPLICPCDALTPALLLAIVTVAVLPTAVKAPLPVTVRLPPPVFVTMRFAPDEPVIVPVLVNVLALTVVLVLPLAAVPLMVPLLETVANGAFKVNAALEVRLKLAPTLSVPLLTLAAAGPPLSLKVAVPEPPFLAKVIPVAPKRLTEAPLVENVPIPLPGTLMVKLLKPMPAVMPVPDVCPVEIVEPDPSEIAGVFKLIRPVPDICTVTEAAKVTDCGDVMVSEPPLVLKVYEELMTSGLNPCKTIAPLPGAVIVCGVPAMTKLPVVVAPPP